MLNVFLLTTRITQCTKCYYVRKKAMLDLVWLCWRQYEHLLSGIETNWIGIEIGYTINWKKNSFFHTMRHERTVCCSRLYGIWIGVLTWHVGTFEMMNGFVITVKRINLMKDYQLRKRRVEVLYLTIMLKSTACILNKDTLCCMKSVIVH